MRETGYGRDNFLGCCMADCQRSSSWSFWTDPLRVVFSSVPHDMLSPSHAIQVFLCSWCISSRFLLNCICMQTNRTVLHARSDHEKVFWTFGTQVNCRRLNVRVRNIDRQSPELRRPVSEKCSTILLAGNFSPALPMAFPIVNRICPRCVLRSHSTGRRGGWLDQASAFR